MLYSVALVPAVQRESVVIIHTVPSLLSLPPFPSAQPSRFSGCHADSCVIKWVPTGHLFYTWPDIYLCSFLNLSHPLLPLLCPQVHSLHLHLHSFPENSFISTIFLDIIHTHTHTHIYIHTHTHTLQCSCLENPRDAVAQSWTRLKWLSSSSTH